jgi:hypothetical protein
MLKKTMRKMVRLFSWDARRFWVMGWHDCMYMDYQPPRQWNYLSECKLYEFRLAHYEDGWNMEVKYSIRLDNGRSRRKDV